jgi:hypothetical protein
MLESSGNGYQLSTAHCFPMLATDKSAASRPPVDSACQPPGEGPIRNSDPHPLRRVDIEGRQVPSYDLIGTPVFSSSPFAEHPQVLRAGDEEAG